MWCILFFDIFRRWRRYYYLPELHNLVCVYVNASYVRTYDSFAYGLNAISKRDELAISMKFSCMLIKDHVEPTCSPDHGGQTQLREAVLAREVTTTPACLLSSTLCLMLLVLSCFTGLWKWGIYNYNVRE